MFRGKLIKGTVIAGFTAFVLALAGIIGIAAETVMVDSAIPSYTKTSGVSGNINSIGSDTMNNLMTLWCEGFTKNYPNVRCQIEGKGSSTAPPALIAGTAQIGRSEERRVGKEC